MGNKLIELYDLAERKDIDVDWFSLAGAESLSVELADGKRCIAIDSQKMDTIAKEATCLAHELVHCVSGGFYTEYSPHGLIEKHEYKADKFAVLEMVPQEEYQQAVKDGHTEIYDLAGHFCVTEDLMKKAVCYYAHSNLNYQLYIF